MGEYSLFPWLPPGVVLPLLQRPSRQGHLHGAQCRAPGQDGSAGNTAIYCPGLPNVAELLGSQPSMPKSAACEKDGQVVHRRQALRCRNSTGASFDSAT